MVDGSSDASAFRCFVRFKTEDGIRLNYLMGGSKLAGVGGNTAVKCEVKSLLMGLRAISSIHNTMKNISFTENILISDSLICLGGLCSNTIQQCPFYSVRNHESRELIDRFEVTLLHTAGMENDSDWGSKLLLSENVALRPCYWTSQWLFCPRTSGLQRHISSIQMMQLN